MQDDWIDEIQPSEDFLDKKFPKGIAGYHPTYALTHPWKILEYYWNEIRYAWQRVFRGWDDRVIWSIDHYLAEKIPLWIKKLQEDCHGIPVDFFDQEDWDYQKCEYKEGAEERAKAKFGATLNQIIIGFESYIKMQNFVISDTEYEKLKETYEIGFNQFQKYFRTLWD